MILLQTPPFEFFEQPDPTANIITIAVFAGLLIIAVVAALVSARRGRGGAGQFNRVAFRRAAKGVNLDRDQVRRLRRMVADLRLHNAQRLFRSPSYLNNALRRELARIDQIDAPTLEKERQKSEIFRIKRTIDLATQDRATLSSTRQLKLGLPLRLTHLGDHITYPSAVSSNLQDAIGVETPESRTGHQVNWRPGTRVRASFVLEGERVFSFDTKVVGYNIVRGVPTVFLEHAENLRQTQKRRSPRIDFDRPAYFYPVEIVQHGRRSERKAVVNRSKRHFGRIEDISAGGCAIRSQTPLPIGSLLKIDFETDDDTQISVFGKVRGTEPIPPRMGIMHIMFTRISRRHLNQIQAYVYGLAAAE